MEKLIQTMMQGFFLIVGLGIVLCGLGYLFAPDLVKKVNRALNSLIFQDEFTFTYRIFTGVIFVVVGLLILYFMANKGFIDFFY